MSRESEAMEPWVWVGGRERSEEGLGVSKNEGPLENRMQAQATGSPTILVGATTDF